MDERVSIPDRGWEFFFSPLRPDRLWDPRRHVYNGTPGGVKQPRREADNSPLSVAEVKNSWSYICVHPYFMELVLF